MDLNPSMCAWLVETANSFHGAQRRHFMAQTVEVLDLSQRQAALLLGWLLTRGLRVLPAAYARLAGVRLVGSAVVLLAYGGLLVNTWWGFRQLPTGYVPNQDQARFYIAAQLPDAASLERTQKVMDRIYQVVRPIEGVDYMTEVAAHNKLPVRDFVRPDGILEKQVDAISGMLPGPHTTHTITEVFKADNVPTEKDNVHVQAGIEKASGKLWQPGCGDLKGASPGPSGSALASASAAPSGAPVVVGSGPVYLNLGDWESAHKTWMDADKAWITRWRGKERGIPRFPLLALDAPLAPAEKCTPGQFPTSTRLLSRE